MTVIPWILNILNQFPSRALVSLAEEGPDKTISKVLINSEQRPPSFGKKRDVGRVVRKHFVSGAPSRK